jgi:hypothetical protein
MKSYPAAVQMTVEVCTKQYSLFGVHVARLIQGDLDPPGGMIFDLDTHSFFPISQQTADRCANRRCRGVFIERLPAQVISLSNFSAHHHLANRFRLPFTIEVGLPLEDLFEQLDSPQFARCHRSIVIESARHHVASRLFARTRAATLYWRACRETPAWQVGRPSALRELGFDRRGIEQGSIE